MPTLFDVAYLTSLPFVAPGFVYKRLVLKKYRESLPGMMGRNLPRAGMKGGAARGDSAGEAGTVTAWLHAVSVGEVVAASAVLKRLHEQCPHWRYLASTVTETGQNKARQTLKQTHEIFYYPFDFSWIVRRFLDHYRPSVYILHETELWPNFLSECGRRRIPVMLANGKLSERSARRYAKARFLFATPLSAFAAFCMQSEGDAERLRVLGVPEKKIHVTGNCKFDAPGEPLEESARREWLEQLGWPGDARVVVAGSTHPGEEEVVLDAFRELRERFPAARLLLAPRHPERFDAVARLIQDRNWGFWRASGGDWKADSAAVRRATGGREGSGGKGGPDVLLLDTMGQLARAYGLAQVAVCGGAWAPIGGHNLLEAAVHSIPVLRGPHMHAQPEIVRILGPEQGGLVAEAANLGKELIRLFDNENLRLELGQSAAAAVARNRGAAARTVEAILRNLPDAWRHPPKKVATESTVTR